MWRCLQAFLALYHTVVANQAVPYQELLQTGDSVFPRRESSLNNRTMALPGCVELGNNALMCMYCQNQTGAIVGWFLGIQEWQEMFGRSMQGGFQC